MDLSLPEKIVVNRLYPFMPLSIREAIRKTVLCETKNLAWCKYYDNLPLNFEKYGIDKCLLIPFINDFLKKSEIKNVIQIGSCSGKEIHYLAIANPNKKFMGIDISKAMVDYAKEKYKADNLEFRCMPAKDLESIISKDSVIFSSGSMQYVQPEDAKELFRLFARYKCTVIFEESKTEYKIDRLLANDKYRGCFAWSHNYKKLAEENNMKIIEYKEIEIRSEVGEYTIMNIFMVCKGV